jgi:P-type E1-E2 ATPase
LHQSLVVVGDIIEIVEGMEIPADGVVIQASELVLDESSMTGETDPVKKGEFLKCMEERD